MKYKYILIDADDTILDFKGAERKAINSTLIKYNLEPSDELVALYDAINDRCWKAFERGELSIPVLKVKRFEEFAAAAGISCDTQSMADDYMQLLISSSEMLDGARELLETLNAMGCKLCLATNGISEVQRGRIARLDINKYFYGIYISEEMGCRKPEAKYFEQIRSALGADRDEMLMLGDSLRSDVTGALDYGICAVWYNPHGKPAGEVKPDYTVSNYNEFLQIIK